MQYEIVTLEERLAAGVAAKTSNQDPKMGEIIGGLWNRFFNEGVYAGLSGKADEKALGIYTDYEGDEKGSFTAMAACAVTTPPGEGVAVCRIPAGRYAKFVARGDMHRAVAEAWQEIWKTDLNRSFQCDFEEYQDGNMDEAEIHIYVGLRD